MLSYAAIDFICTMLNRYVFKDEKENQEEPSALRASGPKVRSARA